MTSMRALARCATLVGTLALLAPAFAAPSPSDVATARALVAEGRKLRAAGDFVHAIEKLKAAYALYRTPVTGDELALAYRDARLLLEARETALEVVRMPVEPDEGKASAKARENCAEMVAELAKRIGRIELVLTAVPPGQEPQVTIDGATIPAAALAEPRQVNPGKHVAVVVVGSLPEKRVEIVVGEGETKKVEIVITTAPPPAPTSLPSTPEKPPEPEKRPTPPKPAVAASSGGVGWLGWTGFGVGAVGLAVGAVAGGDALSTARTLDARCGSDRLCPAAESSRIEHLDRVTTLSTVGFIAAGVGITVGILDIAFSLTSPKSPTTTGGIPVRVGVGPGSCTIVAAF